MSSDFLIIVFIVFLFAIVIGSSKKKTGLHDRRFTTSMRERSPASRRYHTNRGHGRW